MDQSINLSIYWEKYFIRSNNKRGINILKDYCIVILYHIIQCCQQYLAEIVDKVGNTDIITHHLERNQCDY